MVDATQLEFLRAKWVGYLEEWPRLAELREHLLGIGGIEVVPNREEDLDNILKRGRKFSRRNWILRPGQPGGCHSNVSNLWVSNVDTNPGAFEIATGWGMSDDGLWRQHSWGLWHGRLVETTEYREIYYGFVLTLREARVFAENNW
jgi:hypothetical protein